MLVSLYMGEAAEGAEKFTPDLEIPTQIEKESEKSAIQKYLDTLEEPTEEDRAILTNLERREDVRNLTEREVLAFWRGENELVKQVLPRVVANIQEGLKLGIPFDEQSGDGLGGLSERGKKRYEDLQKLLDTQDQNLFPFALTFIVNATYHPYTETPAENFYSAITAPLVRREHRGHKDESDAESKMNNTYRLLNEEAADMSHVLRNRHNIGKSLSGVFPLEYWARQVDPKWYEEKDKQKFGVASFKSANAPPQAIQALPAGKSSSVGLPKAG